VHTAVRCSSLRERGRDFAQLSAVIWTGIGDTGRDWVKLATVEIKGKSFEIEVAEDGDFRANVDGDVVRASTLAELKTKLARRLTAARIKLDIPFVRWVERRGRLRGSVLQKGSVTGIHAANGNLLVRLEGETGTDQESRWSSENYIRPEAAERLESLGLARDAAYRAYEDFVKDHAFDPREEIRKQLGSEALEEK
jgi:hypothetical protein